MNFYKIVLLNTKDKMQITLYKKQFGFAEATAWAFAEKYRRQSQAGISWEILEVTIMPELGG